MLQEAPPVNRTVTLGLSQRNRHLRMHVTVMKHYQPNPVRRRIGPIPEGKCFNINDYPPTSKYLRLHPVFKFVDNYLGSRMGPTMRRVNGTTNNGNKTQCVDDRFITKKSTLPNYHVNASGCVKCCKQNRIQTNMRNITNKNGLRVPLKEAHCGRDHSPAVAEIHEIEPVKTRPVSDDYVDQLKREIKNCITKCSHLQESNEEYAQKLKEELIVSKASLLDEARNKINELKNEIYDYRRQPSKCPEICDTTMVAPCQKKNLGRGAPPEPVKQVDQPTVQEKCCQNSSRNLRTSSSGRFSDETLKSNFEEKLEEANDLIEKVKETLKDIAVQQKTVKPKNEICTTTQAIEACANVNCLAAVANLLRDIDNQNKEIMQKLPKLTNTVEDVDKEQGEEQRMKIEKEVRKKLEEELSKKKEDEMQKQIEAALEKQKEELRLQMVEELEKQKQEILQKKFQEEVSAEALPEKETEANLEDEIRTLLTETEDSIVTQQLEVGDRKDEEMEWIPSSDKDIILQQTASFNYTSSSVSEQIELPDERLETISETSLERGGELTPSGTNTESADVETVNLSNVFTMQKTPMETVLEESEAVEEDVPEPEYHVVNLLEPQNQTKSFSQQLNVEPSTKPKLQIQMLPPVNIRGGLVVQKTLNLHIKPTGSVSNDVKVDQSNVGYEEVKKNLDQDNVEPFDPEECKKFYTHTKSKNQAPSNILTEEALLLLKSYQILDQRKDHTDVSSSSTVNLSQKFFRQMPQPERSLLSSIMSTRASETQSSVTTSALVTGSIAMGLEPSPLMGGLLTDPRKPFEIGFYETKSTQVSGTTLNTIQQEDFLEDYMNMTSAGRFSEREVDQVPAAVDVVEEVPVRDLPSVSSEMSKRRVSLAVPMIEMKASTASERSSMKAILSQTKVEPPLVIDSGSSSNSSELSMEKEPMTKVFSESSSTSTTTSDTKEKRPSGESSTGELVNRKAKESNKRFSIVKKPVVQPESRKKGQTEKPRMLDKELQTSFLSISESTSSALSGQQVDTIKSFIQGLTGGSQEDIAKMRSVPSLGRQKSSRGASQSANIARMKEAEMKSKEVVKPSDSEIVKEEELSMLNYSNGEESADVLTGEVVVDSRKNGGTDGDGKRLKDFHKFAKETLSSKGRSRQESTVLTLVEERMKSLDRGEGGNQGKGVPFYRRVFNRLNGLDQSVSDSIPIDNSVSEGEITCKCSVSSGEVHRCNKQAERRKKPLKKHPERGKESLGGSPIAIARERTQYNNWITGHLQEHKLHHRRNN